MLCFQRYSKVLEMCKGLYGLAAIREMKVNSMYSLIVQDTAPSFYIYTSVQWADWTSWRGFFFFLCEKISNHREELQVYKLTNYTRENKL